MQNQTEICDPADLAIYRLPEVFMAPDDMLQTK